MGRLPGPRRDIVARRSGGSFPVFPLGSNRLRPAEWTSADPAGLPILPGLMLASEVQAGAADPAHC